MSTYVVPSRRQRERELVGGCGLIGAGGNWLMVHASEGSVDPGWILGAVVH